MDDKGGANLRLTSTTESLAGFMLDVISSLVHRNIKGIHDGSGGKIRTKAKYSQSIAKGNDRSKTN